MLTDSLPEKALLRAAYLRSDQLCSLEVPADDRLRTPARSIEKALNAEFGTFLSTLWHEFCHHLDCERFGFRDTPHTRGFYERAAALYHHARSTPAKRLFRAPLPNGSWRIDWPRTNRGG